MEVPLDRTRLVVGRNTDAEVCLDDPTVSRPHAELVCGPFGRWWIHDLGSTNGTKIDGRQITERMLHHRDRVKVGDFEIEFRHTPRDGTLMPKPDDSVPGFGEDTIQLSAIAPLSERAQILPKHLSSVTELGRKLLTTEDVERRLADLLSYFVGEGMPADAAVALRLQADGSTSNIGGPFHRFGPSENGPYRSTAVLRAIWQTRQTVVATNLDEMNRDIELSLPAAVRPVAIVASPLAESDDHVDILYVEFPWRYGTAQWQAMVELIADHYRQARMVWQMRQDLQASARIEHDLSLANEVQSRLLPDCSSVALLDVAVGYEPSHWVGGDYVDAVDLEDGRILLIIADVCGKGLSAALVSSSVHTMVHAHADRTFDLGALVDHLNDYLSLHLPDASFVTLLAVVIDPRSGQLQCINAGHPSAVVISSDGEVRWLQTERNVAVGMMDDASFEMETTTFSPNDTLLMFTDGAFEGFDEASNWSAEKVVASLAHHVEHAPMASSSALANQLTSTLTSMRGAHFRADDTTLLIARYPRD
jgi:phosphoserine phosphatase RsbU/P